MNLTELKEQAKKNLEEGVNIGFANGVIDGVNMEAFAKKIGANQPGRKEYFKYHVYEQTKSNA
jgi:hypothetical protein